MRVFRCKNKGELYLIYSQMVQKGENNRPNMLRSDHFGTADIWKFF